MDAFGKNLAKRAKELGISNAEAARSVGLSERRFSNYVSGLREPDLATMVRIAAAMKTTPNDLLGVNGTEAGSKASKKGQLIDRLNIAAEKLADRDLEAAVVQVEAVAKLRR